MSSATFDHFAKRRQRHNRDVKRAKIAARELENDRNRGKCPQLPCRER